MCNFSSFTGGGGRDGRADKRRRHWYCPAASPILPQSHHPRPQPRQLPGHRGSQDAASGAKASATWSHLTLPHPNPQTRPLMIHLFFPFRPRRLSGETKSPSWWNNVCFVPLCLQIHKDYGEIGVEVLLAGCQSRSHLHYKNHDTKKAVVFFIVIINRQWETGFFFTFYCILWGLCCACLRPSAWGSTNPAGTTFPRCVFIVWYWRFEPHNIRSLNNWGCCFGCLI